MGLKIADMTRHDTGHQSFKISKAINAYTDHTSRSFVSAAQNVYMKWDHDLDIGDPDDVRIGADWLREVDLVHTHNKYRRMKGWGPIRPGVAVLMHQHSRPPMADRAGKKQADAIRSALRVVSTLNLLDCVGNDPARWIPAPLFLDEFDAVALAAKRPEESLDEFWVSHSPTNRGYKGTTDIMLAVEQLRAQGYPIKLKLTEAVSHAEVMTVRAQCDVTYDQMHLCYGNSGLEGMAFRHPALVGPPARVRGKILDVVGHEPYIYVQPETLRDTLRDLIEDASLRKHWASVGRAYVETWHSAPFVARRVAACYETLCRK